jgi:hypothetical protein
MPDLLLQRLLLERLDSLEASLLARLDQIGSVHAALLVAQFRTLLQVWQERAKVAAHQPESAAVPDALPVATAWLHACNDLTRLLQAAGLNPYAAVANQATEDK